MKNTRDLIEALRNTKSESKRKLLDQAATALEHYVREEEEALAASCRLFAFAARRFLGESLAESVNDALHLYYSSEAFHGYDGEREDLLPLLAAFDDEGLNSILLEHDVLRGGQFPAAVVTGGAENG